MHIYQHDSATVFRFKLRGELDGPWVRELEQAWMTATSVLRDKELVVDISGVTRADMAGLKLLCRMREGGARLAASTPQGCPELLKLLDLPSAPPRPGRVWRFLRFASHRQSCAWP